MTNLDIIKHTYENATPLEKRQTLGKYATNNIHWTAAKGFPYAGIYIGLDRIFKNVFKRLEQEWVGFKFKPEDYVAEGDKVVAIGTYSGTFISTNTYFEARAVHLWKLKDQKIISFEQFVDSKTVHDATL